MQKRPNIFSQEINKDETLFATAMYLVIPRL